MHLHAGRFCTVTKIDHLCHDASIQKAMVETLIDIMSC